MSTSTVIITILCLCLTISVYFLVKFSLLILRIEDAIEDSLDVIDERYRSISKVLEIPIFYDSPQIRQVVNDIKVTRDTLLLIANRFASIDSSAVESSNSTAGEISNDQED